LINRREEERGQESEKYRQKEKKERMKRNKAARGSERTGE
jgi:hypothetical protein